MIQAYIDESEKTLLGRSLCAVSASVGTPDEWSRFDEIWDPVLKAAHIPYYHGKDSKCDKLRRPLISAIRSAGVRGFTSSAFRDEFAKASNELKSTLGNHYAFLTLGMALQVRQWANQNNAGPIAYVIEDGQPNVEHVIRVIKTLLGSDAASVISAGKDDFVGLQVADFLAHHTAAMDVGLAWIHQLLGDGPGHVMWAHLDPSGITSASEGMTHLLRRHRHLKARKKTGLEGQPSETAGRLMVSNRSPWVPECGYASPHVDTARKNGGSNVNDPRARFNQLCLGMAHRARSLRLGDSLRVLAWHAARCGRIPRAKARSAF